MGSQAGLGDNFGWDEAVVQALITLGVGSLQEFRYLWATEAAIVGSSWARPGVVVVSSWPRRRQLVNSLPSGKALGGVFCGLLLLRPKTLIALSRLCEMAPLNVL